MSSEEVREALRPKRERRMVPPFKVHQIRERVNINGEKCANVAADLGMSEMGVYMIARGMRRGRVPLSDRMREWMATQPEESLKDCTRKWNQENWIYFIQANTGGPVKVGYARSVNRRLNALQGASPARLLVVAQIPGAMADEKRLHAKLQPERVRGEWFTPGPLFKALMLEIFGALPERLKLEKREQGDSRTTV